METSLESRRFSMKQAKQIVGDLQSPIRRVYWTDFLLTILSGHACFTAMMQVPDRLAADNAALWWGLKALFYAATILLFLRAAMFTH